MLVHERTEPILYARKNRVKLVVSFSVIAFITLALLMARSSVLAQSSSLVGDVHILSHFNLAAGQQPENIALEPDGAADLTFATNRQVVRVTPDGKVNLLATLPAPAGGSSTPLVGAPFLGGIVRAHDGTLYFNYSTGTADLTGIWRLRPGGTPERIAALPANGFANGLALDEYTNQLYVADSVLGTIWHVSILGGTPTAWASGSQLAPKSFIGANGLKVHNGAVWVTNLDAAALLRIPINYDGRAGAIQTRATGLASVDDFAFLGRGDTLLAALNGSSQLALVLPDGTSTIVLTAADGLSNPTSVAVRGRTIYVPSAAYFTKNDPNLLLASL